MEAGNFAPPTRSRADSFKVQAMIDFYRLEGYDAVTLSTREAQQGFAPWLEAQRQGFPVVVANLFRDQKSKKTVFKPFVIKKDHGEKLGVIGLLGDLAWKARRDTATTYVFKSSFEMEKLIKKIARKTDYLTVIGDFAPNESDSLAKRFPEIDLLISSGIKSAERARTIGNTVIIGSATRGYFGNYVEFSPGKTDSSRYRMASQSLDESLPVDSTVLKLVTAINDSIKVPIPPKK